MHSKQLQLFSHANSIASFGFLSPSLMSDDFERLKPVQQTNNPETMQEIIHKVEELKQEFQYKQVNDARFIKMVPVVNVDGYAKVEDPLLKLHQKLLTNKTKQRGKLNPIKSNPITHPKTKKQRLLNFLVNAATIEQAPKIVDNIIKDEREQEHIKSRIQSQRKRVSAEKTLPPIERVENEHISKIANRSHSYNMIKVRHLQHKYCNGGANSYLKKGSRVTGAIIDSLATEEQKRRINHKKSLFYHKHNQAIPEDAVGMWDQRLLQMLEIMKGAKEGGLAQLEWNRKKSKDSSFEFQEFNIDEAFINGQF